MDNTPYNADEAIERMVTLADEVGADETALDETVHDIASSIASNVNNGGLRSQIEYIIAQNGPDGENEVKKLLNLYEMEK